MNEMMGVLMLVVTVAFFVLVFWCVRKEKSLSGFYSQIKVCGRWYAFLTADVLLAGVGSLVAVPVLAVMNFMAPAEEASWTEVLSFAFYAVVLIPIGLLLYNRARKKCPEQLKGRLLWDMVIIMVGTSFRLSLFFLMFLFRMWWELNAPDAYEVNGRTVYAFPGSGDLYDGAGNRVGRLNDDKTEAIMF